MSIYKFSKKQSIYLKREMFYKESIFNKIVIAL